MEQVLASGLEKACSIRVVFRSGPTFQSLLTKVKDPLPAEKQATSFTKYLAFMVRSTLVRPRDASKLGSRSTKKLALEARPTIQL